ncbi:transposase [[Clostridium] colinum]|uniref:transposase n=1 Tax=[Clostridium] colinum TaxID=36835 RepID=UPI002ED5270F
MEVIAKGKYEYWLNEEGLLKIEDWARQGLTDEQIAVKMAISTTTLYAWKNKYTEISETLKKGKEIVDIQVENALLKRALGYTTTEKKVKKEYGEITEEITITKEIPPDPTSAIFWLKNRRPEQWREKREVEQNTNQNTEVDEFSKTILDFVKGQKNDK